MPIDSLALAMTKMFDSQLDDKELVVFIRQLQFDVDKPRDLFELIASRFVHLVECTATAETKE